LRWGELFPRNDEKGGFKDFPSDAMLLKIVRSIDVYFPGRPF